MHKRIFLFSLSLLLLLSFYLFSREVKRGFLKQTDFNVTVRLQNKIPARLDEFWEDAAFFVTPVPSVIIIGLLWLVGVIGVKPWKKKFVVFLIPLFFGLMILGEMYGKNVVHHPAPPFFMIKHPTTIFPTYYINNEFSYPSGHTARAVFLSLAFYSVFIIHNSLFKRRSYRLLGVIGIIAYIAVVAVGRIYLGHHWLSDILGGVLLGGGMGFAIIGLL